MGIEHRAVGIGVSLSILLAVAAAQMFREGGEEGRSSDASPMALEDVDNSGRVATPGTAKGRIEKTANSSGAQESLVQRYLSAVDAGDDDIVNTLRAEIRARSDEHGAEVREVFQSELNSSAPWKARLRRCGYLGWLLTGGDVRLLVEVLRQAWRVRGNQDSNRWKEWMRLNRMEIDIPPSRALRDAEDKIACGALVFVVRMHIHDSEQVPPSILDAIMEYDDEEHTGESSGLELPDPWISTLIEQLEANSEGSEEPRTLRRFLTMLAHNLLEAGSPRYSERLLHQLRLMSTLPPKDFEALLAQLRSVASVSAMAHLISLFYRDTPPSSGDLLRIYAAIQERLELVSVSDVMLESFLKVEWLVSPGAVNDFAASLYSIDTSSNAKTCFAVLNTAKALVSAGQVRGAASARGLRRYVVFDWPEDDVYSVYTAWIASLHEARGELRATEYEGTWGHLLQIILNSTLPLSKSLKLSDFMIASENAIPARSVYYYLHKLNRLGVSTVSACSDQVIGGLEQCSSRPYTYSKVPSVIEQERHVCAESVVQLAELLGTLGYPRMSDTFRRYVRVLVDDSRPMQGSDSGFRTSLQDAIGLLMEMNYLE